MWGTWLERTLSPRETAEYAAIRDDRARAYARIVGEEPRGGCALPQERICEEAVCDAL